MLLIAALSLVLLTTLYLCRYRNSSRFGQLIATLSVVLFIVLTAAYLAADYFTAAGIDESVLYHVEFGMEGAGFEEYQGIMVATTGMVLAALLLGTLCFRWLRPTAVTTRRWLYLLPLLCVIHPATLDILRLYNLLPGSSPDYGDLSDGAAADFSRFYEIPRLNPERPTPNLVLLYLESFERSYFDQALFPGLVEDLRGLESRSLTFVDIREIPGASWTIGGMTAGQCGIPLVTASSGNSMAGMDEFLPGATCMGDVLSQQGYYLSYIGGASLTFAGKGKFYSTHKFNSVKGLDELAPSLEEPDYKSFWGLYDDTLFSKLLEEFETLSAAGKPFALVGLTLDTHHPKGHMSRACGDLVYGDGEVSMLNAVRCSDKLASQFIKSILDSPWADNTLVVVASDHLAMRNQVYDILSAHQAQRRNLLMAFNSHLAPPERNAKPGSTLDVAPTVLQLMGFDVNSFGLGRSLVAEEPTLVQVTSKFHKILRSWRDDIASFWNLPSLEQGLSIDPINRQLHIAQRSFGLPAMLEVDETGELLSIKFDFDTNLQQASLENHVSRSSPDSLLLWVDDCHSVNALDPAQLLDEQGTSPFCLFFGKFGATDHQLQAVSVLTQITNEQIVAQVATTSSKELASQRRETLNSMIAGDDYRLITHSLAANWNSGDALLVNSSGGTRHASTISMGSDSTHLSRGIHLLGVEEGELPSPLLRIDTCNDPEAQLEQAALSKRIAASSSEYIGFLIAVHDSAFCGQADLAPAFETLPLHAWQELQFRAPYIAYLPADGGEASEFIASRGFRLSLSLQPSPPGNASDT